MAWKTTKQQGTKLAKGLYKYSIRPDVDVIIKDMGQYWITSFSSPLGPVITNCAPLYLNKRVALRAAKVATIAIKVI